MQSNKQHKSLLNTSRLKTFIFS